MYLQSKDKQTAYIYVLSGKEDNVVLPEAITLEKYALPKGAVITLLDAPAATIKWQPKGTGSTIQVPKKLLGTIAGKYAVVFKIN